MKKKKEENHGEGRYYIIAQLIRCKLIYLKRTWNNWDLQAWTLDKPGAWAC